jgi:hypothetical protein
MWPGGDVLPGGDGHWEIPAQVKWIIWETTKLVGLHEPLFGPCFCIDETVLFLFLSFSFFPLFGELLGTVSLLFYSFHLSAGMKGSGWGSLPPDRLTRRRRGIWLSYSS